MKNPFNTHAHRENVFYKLLLRTLFKLRITDFKADEKESMLSRFDVKAQEEIIEIQNIIKRLFVSPANPFYYYRLSQILGNPTDFPNLFDLTAFKYKKYNKNTIPDEHKKQMPLEILEKLNFDNYALKVPVIEFKTLLPNLKLLCDSILVNTVSEINGIWAENPVQPIHLACAFGNIEIIESLLALNKNYLEKMS